MAPPSDSCKMMPDQMPPWSIASTDDRDYIDNAMWIKAKSQPVMTEINSCECGKLLNQWRNFNQTSHKHFLQSVHKPVRFRRSRVQRSRSCKTFSKK